MIQPGWAVSASRSRVGRVGVLTTHHRDLRKPDARRGQVGRHPHRLEITFFGFLEVTGPKQSVAQRRELCGAGRVAGLGLRLIRGNGPIGTKKTRRGWQATAVP